MQMPFKDLSKEKSVSISIYFFAITGDWNDKCLSLLWNDRAEWKIGIFELFSDFSAKRSKIVVWPQATVLHIMGKSFVVAPVLLSSLIKLPCDLNEIACCAQVTQLRRRKAFSRKSGECECEYRVSTYALMLCNGILWIPLRLNGK